MRLLLIPIFTVTLTLISNASDQLAFDIKETTDASIYSLQLRNERSVKTIWTRRVPLINGKKPYDWCNLRGWAKNQHGLLALVENNEFFGKLLQFNSNGDLIAELEAGGGWLIDIRRGGSIELEPPDKIALTRPDGSITKFIIRDGKLADEDGRMFEHPQSIQIGKPTSDTAPTLNLSASQLPQAPNTPASVRPRAPKNAPEAKYTALKPSEESASSPPWTIFVVLIVSATGVLWLLVKKRK